MNNDNIKDYVPYEQMTDEEKRRVDMLVEQYKAGQLNSEYCGIGDSAVDNFINTKLDLDRMNRINNKLLEDEASKNYEANMMRYQLFEDRWKNGYYGNDRRVVPSSPVNVNINNDSNEVKELKNEVKSLKNDINELKELLKQNLK